MTLHVNARFVQQVRQTKGTNVFVLRSHRRLDRPLAVVRTTGTIFYTARIGDEFEVGIGRVYPISRSFSEGRMAEIGWGRDDVDYRQSETSDAIVVDRNTVYANSSGTVAAHSFGSYPLIRLGLPGEAVDVPPVVVPVLADFIQNGSDRVLRNTPRGIRSSTTVSGVSIGLEQPMPRGLFGWDVEISFMAPMSGNGYGIYVGDSSTGNSRLLAMVGSSGSATPPPLFAIGAVEATTGFVYNTSTPVAYVPNFIRWFRMTDDGTNHTYYWRTDGFVYTQIYQCRRTSWTTTPDRIGVFHGGPADRTGSLLVLRSWWIY